MQMLILIFLQSVKTVMNEPILKSNLKMRNVPITSKNTWHTLLLEWTLFAFYCLLMFSHLEENWNNFRIILLSVLFLLVLTLSATLKITAILDPLQINPLTNFIKSIILLLRLNVIYLAVRINKQEYKIQHIIILLYCLANYYSYHRANKNPKKKINIGIEDVTMEKLFHPFFLYLACTYERSAQLPTLLFLILFGINLFLSLQIRRITNLGQSAFVGYAQVEDKNPKCSIWNRKYAIKTLLYIFGGFLLLENFLLAFSPIRKASSLAIVHTLILGSHVYYLYIHPPRI